MQKAESEDFTGRDLKVERVERVNHVRYGSTKRRNPVR